MQTGNIYMTDWDIRPFRVLCFDEIEVLYDSQNFANGSLSAWAFSGNLNKKCHFYRISAALMLSRATLLRQEPLTQEEALFFRPDLPLRFGRSLQLNWNAFPCQNYDEYLLFLSENNINFSDKIAADRVILSPIGNAGGTKKSKLVEADNGEYFTVAELVWKAKQLQEAVNTKISQGIGLYRLGIEKGLPSFYIGEYIDVAKLMLGH